MNESDQGRQSGDTAQDPTPAKPGEATLAEWEIIDLDIRLPLMRGGNPGLSDIHRRIGRREA